MDSTTSQNASRRRFLKSSTGLVAASGLAAPFVVRGQSSDKTVKVGLIGCGGRGSGAAAQALKADPNARLWALGDVFESQVNGCLRRFEEGPAGAAGQVKVEEGRRHAGLDAFQKVVESDVDVVILATPPGFRPQHLKAAVEAGKHVFCEKPMAVDVPGVRSVMESAALAQANNLNLVAGFCWRYNTSRREAMKRVHDGEIGDITSYYATYYTGPVKPMPPASSRPPGIGDVEWQVRNWYNFCWLSGDSLVEQAVHSVDKISWAMGDKPPIAAVASGGRQVPNHEGNIFDHFNVTYEYPDGVFAFMASRQIPNCFNENADYIHGTQGRCVIPSGKPSIHGANRWRFRGEDNDMYQEEHDTLFGAIREGRVVNDGEWMATSTMLAILGRMAAYTGQRIEWEEAMKSTHDLASDTLQLDDDFNPGPIPTPGLTEIS